MYVCEEEEEEGRPIAARRGERRGSQASTGERPTEDSVPFLPFAAIGEGELPTSEHPRSHVVGEGELPTSEHPRSHVVGEGEPPTSEHPRPLVVAEGELPTSEHPRPLIVAEGRPSATEEPGGTFARGRGLAGEEVVDFAEGPANGFLEGSSGRWLFPAEPSFLPAGGPAEGGVEGRFDVRRRSEEVPAGSRRGAFADTPEEDVAEHDFGGGDFIGPVEESFRLPVEGIPIQPGEGSHRQSIEGSYRQPVEGSHRQPIEGSFRQPVEGISRQPVEGSFRQPVEGTFRQPVEGIPRQPVEGIFRQPAGGSGIAGEASDAGGAGPTSDVPRWPLAPPPSFLFEGEGESYPSATRRGFASVEGSRRSKRQAGYVPFSSSNSGGDPMGILVVEENHGPAADGERRPFDARMPIYNSDFLSEEEPSEREDSKLPGGFPLVAPWFDIAGEGAPGESGSAAARDLSQLPTSLPAVPNEGATEGKGPRRQDKDNDVAGYGRDTSPDLVQAEQYGESETRVTPHALSLTRIRLKLKHEATLTGNASRTFVMRGGGGVLQQGSTYVVQVSVTDKINGNQSSALTYFSVNKGPRFGKCTVQPEVGVELETEFKVHCMEWKDKNLPLWYEISYALADNEPRQLIYYGFHHEAKFLLPSGTEDRNNSVSVRVAVRDSIGGRTSVCAMAVAVLPANETALNINHLAAMTQGAGGRLRTYVAHGDEYAARHYAAASARTLDRLAATARDKDAGKEEEEEEDAMGEEDAAQASAVRAALLGVVAELPLRTEFDCLQAVTDLAAITSAPRQLTPATLKLAIDFLKAVVTRVADEATDRLDGDFVHLFGTAASNILRGVVETQPGAWLAKRVMSSVELSVTKLIRVELGYRTQDEKPFNLTTPFVSVLASRYVVATATTLAADHAAFTLPQQMLGSRHGNGTDGCYEAHMLTFHQDPFGWGKNPVESEVASLTVYTCDGEEVVVKDLSPRQQVTMEIPRQHTENEVEADFVLGKERMNIHQFNVTVDNFAHSLHIVLHMHGARDSSQDGGRLFPISLLLSYDSPPTPDNYEVRQDFEVGEKELRLFLPVGALNVSGPYYLGIVDGTFNAGRPRGDEVQAQTYTLQLWFGQCLYFDDGLDMWSDKGCLPMESSTYTATHCRCNHLTAFGASFLTPQMTFMTVEVESFFRLNENALSYGLLVQHCSAALVFALCARADLHDATKRALSTSSTTPPRTSRREPDLARGSGMSETRELVSSDGSLCRETVLRTFIMT
ncbi:PREDICTED: polycystic kidney disease 1-related protein-like [Priapulus caudatus]|uniref:Polycystic kidney disease 1-related protein-like n=1 Tax=Priapulus caudatus TaxID=37621 RepID=A0ABM1EL70_PRICU|nr:PREDICTED: polycystic kidney disease 1-related protein-like [Priapulus caudatus]